MKKLGTPPRIAHKLKIKADFTLRRIWLSLEEDSFEVGLFEAFSLKFRPI